MKIRLILLAGAVVMDGAVGASANDQGPPSDAPTRYTRTMPLTVTGKEAVAQLPVPREVYMATQSQRLDDLRIFDRDGKAVPFALVDQAEAPVEEAHQSKATVFPLNDRADSADVALAVRASIGGKLVSLDASSAAKPAGGKLGGLILDLGDADTNGGKAPTATALQLRLPAGVDNYTARIAVEESDDLKNWIDDGEAVVSWLANADNKTLASDRIELDGAHGRYARLRWHEGTPLQFAAIAVEWHARSAVPPQRETMLIAGMPGRAAGDVVYAAARGLPIRALGLQFEQRNVVTQAALGHYIELPVLKQGQAPRFDFESLYRTTFYRLEQGGKVRASGDIPAGSYRVAQWVLRPAAPLDPAPLLRLSWEPDRIIFFAAGATPYTLAVGRADAHRAAVAVGEVAPGFAETDLAKLERASVGTVHDQIIAAPSASETQLLASAARTRNVILWSVLVVGVLAVTLMVRQLMEQMRQPATPVRPDAGGSRDA